MGGIDEAIRKLTKRAQAIALDAATLAGLEGEGLVVRGKNRAGALTLKLTEAGARRKIALQDEEKRAKKTASGTGRPAKKRVTVADLEGRVALLEQQVAGLLAQTTRTHQPSSPDPVVLDQAVTGALRELERERFASGVVPIPALRERVIANTGATREAVDSRLVALDRERRLQLSAANDPARIDRALAIDAGPRGWLYFAMSSESGR